MRWHAVAAKKVSEEGSESCLSVGIDFTFSDEFARVLPKSYLLSKPLCTNMGNEMEHNAYGPRITKVRFHTLNITQNTGAILAENGMK